MKVQARTGDSLSYYSHLFKVPLNLIKDANLDKGSIEDGTEVLIPGFETIPYRLKEGESFHSIASYYNLSVDALRLLNQDFNPDESGVGTILSLPKRIIKTVVDGKTSYDFEKLTSDIERLRGIYPFVRINTIGESVLGKPLHEIQIGRGAKRVHINASFHANEWITTSILMTFLDSYLLSLTNFASIRGLQTMPFYDMVELSIVPMVNPDGVDLVLNGPPPALRDEMIQINGGDTEFTAWKANIRGVDLNNQYPAKWEVEKERKIPKAPASRDYPGDRVLAEPEAIAMAELAKDRNFERVIALHTQGEEFYWGYEGFEPEESERLAQEFQRVSGYKAVRYVDSHAGYKDWFIQDLRKPGFTIELGKGINPLPLSQFESIYERVLGIFMAGLYM